MAAGAAADTGRAIGIGGVFLTSPDPKATMAWYRAALGLGDVDEATTSTMLPFAAASETHGPGALSVFSVFEAGTDYFKPSAFPVMINFMVDDLDAALARALAHGAEQVDQIVDEPYGRFAWLLDCDGRKIELWQPKAPA